MSAGSPVRRLVGVSICVVLFLMTGQSVLAAEFHEDPAAAEPVYSGVALLDYYAGSLDYVLQKDPAVVATRLGKMPFAYIPPSLAGATGDFTSSGIEIANLVVGIDQGLSQRQELVGQFRLDEAKELTDLALAHIDQAYSELAQLRQAAETTGEELGVSSAQASTSLKDAYERVLERLDRIEAMLALYRELLASWLVSAEGLEAWLESLSAEELEEWLETAGAEGLEEWLKATEVTLRVEPTVAYVGDSVQFSGRLTSQGEGLPGREVDILLDGASYATVVTDTYGYYGGSLSIPYWYTPELSVQALYYPQEEDIGHYLASLSPEIEVRVLFYEASLAVEVANRAYPGRATPVSGRFDYGVSPTLEEREIEILLDDVVVFQGRVGPAFTEEIMLAAETEVGKYIVTVSAVASGRYAPAVASVILEVSRATPVLEMGLPGLALAPGHLDTGGRLASEVGPLDGAQVELELGRSRAAVTSSAGGEFDTEIKLGMGLGVIGSQDLVVRVFPQEPWHAPLVTARPVLVMNVVNCGVILVVLVALGVYLPGALRRRLGVRMQRRARPAVVVTTPRPAVVKRVSSAVASPVVAPVDEIVKTSGDGRQQIFGWYRRVVRVILKVARTIFRPQQTLREFAREQSGILGIAARYFVELTGMVERLLYSRYEPTKEDEWRGSALAHTIEEELKGEGL